MLIEHRPLPYESKLTQRSIDPIELLVIHCTELPDLDEARRFGEKVLYPSGTGNSGHYYIDRDGRVECWVKPEYIAHHVKGHNENSIGIELDNLGRYPDWFHSQKQTPQQNYTEHQIKQLIALVQHLESAIPSLKHMVGHEDLDQDMIEASDHPGQQVRRKIDPGPLFPWDVVMPNSRLTNIAHNAKNKQQS